MTREYQRRTVTSEMPENHFHISWVTDCECGEVLDLPKGGGDVECDVCGRRYHNSGKEVAPPRPASKPRAPLNYDPSTALVGGILLQSLKGRK